MFFRGLLAALVCNPLVESRRDVNERTTMMAMVLLELSTSSTSSAVCLHCSACLCVCVNTTRERSSARTHSTRLPSASASQRLASQADSWPCRAWLVMVKGVSGRCKTVITELLNNSVFIFMSVFRIPLSHNLPSGVIRMGSPV